MSTSSPSPSLSTGTTVQADESAEHRARDVKGCMMWKEYSGVERRGCLNSIVSHFQSACKTAEFSSLWAASGFDRPTFHPNTELRASRPSHDKFLEGLQKLDRGACLGVVFHGTSTGNIKAILQNGLDPARRKGQAYGPGEYFSKDPGVSIGFCHGGLEMVVFVVVLPSTAVPSDKDNEKAPSNSAPFGAPFGGGVAIPADYVVVANNLHQIPIGTMKFTQVNQAVMKESQTRRAKFLALSQEVFQKSQISKEARIKAQIIQDLIANQVDLASEKYQMHCGTLSSLSRREISWYVHQQVDEEVMSFCFSDLPDPFRAEEIDTVTVQSLDDATRKEEEAKQRLKEERLKDAQSRALTLPSQQRDALGVAQALSQVKLQDKASASHKEEDPTTAILQHLIADRADMASELYLKHKKKGMTTKDKLEISEYAKRHVDNSLLDFLFPGLSAARKCKQDNNPFGFAEM